MTDARRARRRRTLRVVVPAAALAVGLVAGEVGLRLGGRGPRGAVGESLEASLWIKDPRLGLRNRPNARVVSPSGATVTTGPHGERGPVAPIATGQPVVLFVGDSTTFCGEVDDDATGPSEVARRLPPGPRAAVVNAGVRGFNTLQAGRMAEEWLARRPARVVVHLVCHNDYVENVGQVIAEEVRAPIGFVDAATGRVEVEELPSGWGPPGAQVTRDARFALGSWQWWLDRAQRRSALARVAADLLEPPPRAGVWARARAWADERGAARVFAEALGRLARTCEARGAKLVVCQFTKGDAEDETLLAQAETAAACRALGVPFVDLRPAFPRPAVEYRARLLNGVLDPHWNRDGTAAFGEALAPHLAPLLR